MAIKRITQRVNDATNQSNLITTAFMKALDLDKTVNGNMSVNEVAEKIGDALITSGELVVDNELSSTSKHPVQNKVVTEALNGKQATLVSGTNIKTINQTSILGEGDITISGGDGIAVIEIGGALSPEGLEPTETLTITSDEFEKAATSDASIAKVNILISEGSSSYYQPLYLQKMTNMENGGYAMIMYTTVVQMGENEYYSLSIQLQGSSESYSVSSSAAQMGGGSTSTSKVLDIGTLSGAITTGSTFDLSLDSTDPIYDPETIIMFKRSTSTYYAFPAMNSTSQDDRHSYDDGSITRSYCTNYGAMNSNANSYVMFNFSIQTLSSTTARLTTSYINYDLSGVPYQTTAPSAANTSGKLKFVVLDSEPATYYDGYYYIITTSQA